jgi:P27 family predicted phage terminase small subunit
MNYPKPTAVKEMLGIKPKATIVSEPKGNKLSADMKAPDYLELDQDELQYWKRVVAVLANSQIGTELDIDAIADYCRDSALAATLRKDIKANGWSKQIINKSGNASAIRNQSVTTLKETLERINKFRNEFGLNPVARTRIKATGEAADDSETFLFGEYEA